MPLPQTQTPPRYQIPPGPNYSPSTGAIVGGQSSDLDVPGASRPQGLLNVVFQVFKEFAPELLVNAVVTRTNFSDLGVLVRNATRSPISFGVAIAGALGALITKGQGTLGASAVVVAKGAAHATTAELARPKSAGADAQISSGVESAGTVETAAPTES